MAKRVYIGRVTRSCEECGVDVVRKASAFKEHIFCSRACYLRSPHHSETVSQANRTRTAADGRSALICDQCGADFQRYVNGRPVPDKTYCSKACQGLSMRGRQITEQGYVKLFVGKGEPGTQPTGHILEHRLVMQRHLQRALLPHENVHHVNGDRADNRLQNLELWSKSQPAGQRVDDKVAWARQILAEYEGLLF